MRRQQPTAWHLSEIWNATRDIDRTRSYEPRDYIWASELGGSFYDRYWKMHGRDATTPPNLRSQRKFDSGNLIEWIVKQIFVQSHVQHRQQDYIVNTEGAMKVTGKADFIAGGKIKLTKNEDLPDILRDVSEATIAKLKEMFPKGLPIQGLEIKSISSFAFPMVEKAPMHHHALQSFHYAYNTKLPFHLVYICKDDLRMVEWVISPDSGKWKELYFEDIYTMSEVYKIPEEGSGTDIYLLGIKSVKEQLLLFSDKFKKNIKIEYSSYLTDYGYERPDEYSDKASSVARRLNNIVKKINSGKEMTGVNEKTLTECYTFYPQAEMIINNLKEK